MDRASFEIVDATESHLPGIQAIYNQAVRETFSIWSETETTLDARRTGASHASPPASGPRRR